MNNLEAIKEEFIQLVQSFNIEEETYASKLHIVWQDGPKEPIYKGSFRIELHFDHKS